MKVRGTMWRRFALGSVGALTILALTTGCGDSGMDHDNDGMPGMNSSPASPGGVNDADVSFAQNMIPHHQQAVEMADLAARQATDPEIKQLAAKIKDAQAPEITILTGMLTGWGKPTMPAMGHAGMAMPGMMSADDMRKLAAATGTAFDRMFAQMMIAHHNGAIQMAGEEKAKGGDAEAKSLAATIESAQAAEVTQLEAILDRL
jgi:uncharacterized protein (DUF305 family)